jgi:predicted TIM-barrel fold metal-dependent hydrolase
MTADIEGTAAPSFPWVDVHHHSYFPDIVALLARHGIDEMAPGVPVPTWSEGAALEAMDAAGIDAAVASVVFPDAAAATAGLDARALARRTNELLADLVARHPGRFGALAALPLPGPENAGVDAALREAAYALDELHLDGVLLTASLPDGSYLGAPALDPLLAELSRRRATVFVHPNPSCGRHRSPGQAASAVPAGILDFVADTTRAALDLLLGGALDRHPGLRPILAHAGGTLPYLAWRIELAGGWIKPSGPGAPAAPRATPRRFRYETAQSASPEVLTLLRDTVGAENVLFGTDYPFIQGPALAETRRRVAAHGGFGAAERVGVASGAAYGLFPALRDGRRDVPRDGLRDARRGPGEAAVAAADGRMAD